ncbi:uncharacterized protein AKAW2_51444S [Aspergillus luchuensis]|uniref:SNF2 N-terminal domain-containing protein n=1 Tax=Aspergillus kawachii TaxID=1069201 RepID=A0A7R7X0Z0_ASPKA|nr:uncharacterized protein AKAW2_51444S [Aspergillus luchuensis]BCS01103.1 hypothetical protein AKAW2_51444S [Aspergillus luchuensis]BCS12856.1 hypothetical protein ALUC_50902S [Aspergillus luchuensis]GAA82881.1 hypothetical protein AKAW_00996 [Aspergillus luchuensis IFO 4308]
MRSASSWPRDLSGIFGTLVIDEAHTLRNRNTAQWTAAHAINAKSTTLATATPLFNSFKDFGALYPSLIPSSNESTRYAGLSDKPSWAPGEPVQGQYWFRGEGAGENALKHWVLYLGWQQARYLHEPKNKISHESPIWRYAQACEELASIYKAFQNKFGNSSTG